MSNQAIIEQDPDISLVLVVQQGDRQAFGQLVERYERSVYATAYRRLSNHAEVQEVCQEVFVKAMEKIGQLRAPECFGGWLRSMTGRMAINRRGAARLRRSTSNRRAWPASASRAKRPERPPWPANSGRGSGPACACWAGWIAIRSPAFYVEGQSLVEMSDHFASPVGTSNSPAARGPEAVGQGIGRAGRGLSGAI